MKIQSSVHELSVPSDITRFETYQAIWYGLGIIEVLLVFRGVMNVGGVGTVSPFIKMIYELSAPFALPFQSVLVAMIVYFIVTRGFVEFLEFTKAANVNEVMVNLDSA